MALAELLSSKRLAWSGKESSTQFHITITSHLTYYYGGLLFTTPDQTFNTDFASLCVEDSLDAIGDLATSVWDLLHLCLCKSLLFLIDS